MSDLRIPDLNMVVIAGRLTRDPELKYTGSGRAYCRLSVANSRFYKSKEGEKREETVFVEGTVWDKQAEWVGERLRKGRPVIVEGRLRQSEWEDRESGQKRTRLELSITRITPLDWDDDGGGHRASADPATTRPASAPRVTEEPMPEDDIPF